MEKLKGKEALWTVEVVPDPGPQGEINRLKRQNAALQETVNTIVKIFGDCRLVICCKDCKYSVDSYGDGDCYCTYDNNLQYIGKNWNHYCGYAVRRQE